MPTSSALSTVSQQHPFKCRNGRHRHRHGLHRGRFHQFSRAMIAAIALVVLLSTIGTFNMLSAPPQSPTGANMKLQSPKHFRNNQLLQQRQVAAHSNADSGDLGRGQMKEEYHVGDGEADPRVAVAKSVEAGDDVEQESEQLVKGQDSAALSAAGAGVEKVKNKDAEERDEVREHIMSNILQTNPSSNSQGALSVVGGGDGDTQHHPSAPHINQQVGLDLGHRPRQRQLFYSNGKNIFNTEKHFLINHRDTCRVERKSAGNGDKVKVVLFLIPSEPKNSLRRKIIRQTWLNTTNVTTDIVFRNLFVLGKPSYSVSNPEKWESTLELLKWENRLYNDILVGDFVEDYWNLTYKTMFGITWANFFCQGADFIFKIDDDVLVLQNKFLPLLQTFPTQDFFGGLCMKKGKPHRNKKSKWYISKQEFPRYRYPPFCYGPSYFFSSDLLPHIFNATLHVNFFKLEDVYMGLCIEHAGKNVQTIKGVSNVSPKYTYCAYKDLTIIHGIEPTKWSMYFRDIAKRSPQNIICPKKVQKRTVHS